MSPTDQRPTGDPLAPHSLTPAELKDLLAIERKGIPFLAYRDGTGALNLAALDGPEQLRTLGRDPGMDLAIAWDSEVSGLHAELRRLGDHATITDDGLSKNGTYINGQRLLGRTRLRDGDRIRIGRSVLVYRSGEQHADSTVAAGDLPGLIKLTDMQKNVLVALCRPLKDGSAFATPATNQQIAADVFLSVDAVKMHLRNLFGKFEVGDLAQNQKRAKLAESALQLGVITPRDLQ